MIDGTDCVDGGVVNRYQLLPILTTFVVTRAMPMMMMMIMGVVNLSLA